MPTAEQILDAFGRGAFVGASTAADLIAKSFASVPVSVKSFGAQGDGLSDDTQAFAQAMASGQTVIVPKSVAAYVLSGPLTLGQGTVLIGTDGRPTLKFVGQWAGGNIAITGDDAVVRDLIVDCDPASKTSANSGITIAGARAIVENVDVVHHFSDGIRLDGATATRIQNVVIDTPDHGPAIVLDGATGNLLEDIEFIASTGFCVYLENGAAGNRLHRLRTTASDLELVGITYTCFENEVSHCHAEGCGDNGISITGFRNKAVANTCIGNAHSGIHLYGKNNICIGNDCRNNNTVGSTFGGIRVQGAFGGLGYRNIVVGNKTDDEQDVPTQAYGLRLVGGGYSDWDTGQVIDSINDYRVHNRNIYKPAATGTTGPTPPTHVDGTVTDGGVDWLYVDTFEADDDNPRFNTVSGNQAEGNVTADFDDATNGSVPNAIQHKDYAQFEVDGVTARVACFNGSPEGAVAAPKGSMVLRPGGSTGISAYVKVDSSVDTGWEALLPRAAGSTANRPANVGGVGYAGYLYFDTDLDKPLWWSGSAWVDATGTAV